MVCAVATASSSGSAAGRHVTVGPTQQTVQVLAFASGMCVVPCRTADDSAGSLLGRGSSAWRTRRTASWRQRHRRAPRPPRCRISPILEPAPLPHRAAHRPPSKNTPVRPGPAGRASAVGAVLSGVRETKIAAAIVEGVAVDVVRMNRAWRVEQAHDEAVHVGCAGASRGCRGCMLPRRRCGSSCPWFGALVGRDSLEVGGVDQSVKPMPDGDPLRHAARSVRMPHNVSRRPQASLLKLLLQDPGVHAGSCPRALPVRGGRRLATDQSTGGARAIESVDDVGDGGDRSFGHAA